MDLLQAYHPTQFRERGHQLVDLLAEYLQRQIVEESDPTNSWKSPAQCYAAWEDYLKNETFDFETLVSKILEDSNHLHHPKYVGHQVGVVLPDAALMGLLGSLLNNGVAVYEVGQGAVAIERLVMKAIALYFGWSEEADGVLTSGGTLGNLTALLTARSVIASNEVWTEGHGQQLAIMVSEEAHYCVDRAVKTMGWGNKGIIKVPTDDQFRMKTELLKTLLEEAKQQGIQVVAVVGSACTTSTGTFDDLAAIGKFCQQHNIWFHVDGAHGASAVFAPMYRHLLKGIELADSVVMDFHKMLMLPALTTGVFYRNGKQSYRTFLQKAHYLWNNEEDQEWYNLGKRTYECTKLMISIKVLIVWKQYGTSAWETYVTKTFQLGNTFAKLIAAQPDFELAVSPDCNIVCFRYIPQNQAINLNYLNDTIRQYLLEDGEYYMVKTVLRGNTYLRTTLMNPFTTITHLERLLNLIREIGEENFGAMEKKL